MRILYVTTIGSTMSFFPEHIKMLLEYGNEVELACNLSSYPNRQIPDKKILSYSLKTYDVPFSRSPTSFSNFKAFRILRKIVKSGHYDIVHCHTPIAAMITRLVCRKYRKNGLKVFYTAHGFHFYKGAPLKNWLLFYPIEKLCSRWTDVLITINGEDYKLASKKMKAKSIKYVPGVGINTKVIDQLNIDKIRKRKELKINSDCVVYLSVGELNDNKNHENVIKAFGELKREHKIDDFYYFICGKGDKETKLNNLIKNYNLCVNVFLIGYRSDILEILKITDCFIFPSFREGLSVSLMEAMASGVPIICSRIRGNVDLIDENGGFLFDPSNICELKEKILNFENLSSLERKNMGIYNTKKVSNYKIENVLKELSRIYSLA